MSPILTCLLCHHHCCLADGEIGFAAHGSTNRDDW